MNSSNDYIKKVSEAFNLHKNETYAVSMKAYMRNKFEYFGINSPLRKEISKEFLAKDIIKNIDLKGVVIELWNLPEREFQYFALELIIKKSKELSFDFFDTIDVISLNKSWWDTIDVISPKIVPAYFKLYPNEIEKQRERLSNSDNFWQNRISILYQLSYKKNTDKKFLFKNCEKHSNSNEFFIQKAIGWALREYYKTNSIEVFDFVNKTNLKPLSKREALKHHKKV